MATAWNTAYHANLQAGTAGTLLGTHERFLKEFHNNYRDLQAMQHTTQGMQPHPTAVSRREQHAQREQQRAIASTAAEAAQAAAAAAQDAASAAMAGAAAASQPAQVASQKKQGGPQVKKMCRGCRCVGEGVGASRARHASKRSCLPRVSPLLPPTPPLVSANRYLLPDHTEVHAVAGHVATCPSAATWSSMYPPKKRNEKGKFYQPIGKEQSQLIKEYKAWLKAQGGAAAATAAPPAGESEGESEDEAMQV